MTDATADLFAPSLDDFARLAREAFDALPAEFRAAAGEVMFRIDDFADEQTLADLEIETSADATAWDRRRSRRGSSCIAVRSWTNGASAATSAWPN